MPAAPSATPAPATSGAPPSALWAGYGYGLLGVAIFSLTLPMTRLVVGHMDPLLVGLGRALLAALPAALWLIATGSRKPTPAEWRGIALSACGIVVGWPLASTLAMQSVPAAHGAVFNGLLPLSTALFAAWRAGERPARGFWVWAVAGAVLVTGFALAQGHGSLQTGDLWLALAVVLDGLGYAEGARVARTLGGARTICWTLVACAPLLAAPVGWLAAAQGELPAPGVLAAFAYLAFFSMFLGFFAWFRGLASGGIARVGQVQLLQPFLSVVAAAACFGEDVPASTWFFAVAVVAVITCGRRAAQGSSRP